MRTTIQALGLSLALSCLLLSFNSCADTPAGTDPGTYPGSGRGTGSGNEWRCGTYNGKTLYTGPQGGCYYYNSKGNRTYVDRSKCNC